MFKNTYAGISFGLLFGKFGGCECRTRREVPSGHFIIGEVLSGEMESKNASRLLMET